MPYRYSCVSKKDNNALIPKCDRLKINDQLLERGACHRGGQMNARALPAG